MTTNKKRQTKKLLRPRIKQIYLRKLKKIHSKFFINKFPKQNRRDIQRSIIRYRKDTKRSGTKNKYISERKSVQNLHIKFLRKIPLKKIMDKYPKRNRYRIKMYAKTNTYWKKRWEKWAWLSKKKKKLFLKICRKSETSSYIFSKNSPNRKIAPWIYKQNLNKNLHSKYKKLKKLRLKLFERKLKTNKKKYWLIGAYRRNLFNTNTVWKRKRKKHDFLKTILGQYFIFAQISTKFTDAQKWLVNKRFFKTQTPKLFTMLDKSKEIQLRQKLGWFYTNLTCLKKVQNYITISTKKTYPYNLFSTYWINHKKAPWLDFLQSKRRLYSSLLQKQRREQKWSQKFTWIPYLRTKKPFKQKRNKLYHWRNNLLFSHWTRNRIQKRKAKRIKKILSKIILPFYGNISEKQFSAINKKVQKKKPENISRDDFLLGKFETRLDIVVYRLNLAPNIFWARRLIQTGSIFVSSTTNEKLWEKMHAPLKKYIYPLKLRDPMNLYKKTIWNPFKRTGKIKFLLEPITKINYFVKPSEIIQCAPGALLNKFKTNSILATKPIPKYFLHYSNISETQQKIRYNSNKISAVSTTENNHTIIATLLYPPTYNHFLRNDRINREFIRWITL
jgi:hypothetical protein